MGIFIYMAVSHQVSEAQWTEVYEESLHLAEVFPLGDIVDIEIGGAKVTCFASVQERTFGPYWPRKEVKTGWRTSGDLVSLRYAEDYFLFRNLPQVSESDIAPIDAMMGAYELSSLAYDDRRHIAIHELWDAKTQGEPYHLYLLAIACLIEDRLGDNAFVYGDITAGQCRKAVELANAYLDRPIRVPPRCDKDRLYERVRRSSVDEITQIKAFMWSYLGAYDMELGAFLRKAFGEDALWQYWQGEFTDISIGNLAYSRPVVHYLTLGFSVRELASFVALLAKDDDQIRVFVDGIMDLKLHSAEKDCRDVLAIDQDEEAPYSIYTLLAQFAFGGIRNRAVNRYIPLEVLIEELVEGLGHDEVVRSTIDECLVRERGRNEADQKAIESDDMESISRDGASRLLNDAIEQGTEKLKQQHDRYDIADYGDLLFYEDGYTLRPGIEKSLKSLAKFYAKCLEEDKYAELMACSPQERFEWLGHTNRALLLLDNHWQTIYHCVLQDKEAFARYYPAVCVNIKNDDIRFLVSSVTVNDALYELVKTMGPLSSI